MNPNLALWEKGDFTQLARTMRRSGERFVASLGILPGMKVLDVGCGDGTTAIPAARAGADVLGVDIARNLVEAGNRRAREAGLSNIRFEQGDACELLALRGAEHERPPGPGGDQPDADARERHVALGDGRPEPRRDENRVTGASVRAVAP